MNKHSNGSTPRNPICEVYEDNFIAELKHMSSYLDEYNYIGMDTEFPGITVKIGQYTQDFYYKSIKANVDELKLIQLGITLCNSKRESPPNVTTWQFNFQFDIKNDKYSSESLNLLIKSGINFDNLRTKGIPHNLFAEYFIISGLLLNPNVHWISYHGSSDFAYLLKYILNESLPKSEKEFTEKVCLYFPSHYDIKVLIQGKDNLKGGLNKIASVLDIYRTGEEHQAGSDSIVTAAVFFSLISMNILTIESVHSFENIIYGLGEGEDNKETILYTPFENGVLNNKSEFEQKVLANININSTPFVSSRQPPSYTPITTNVNIRPQMYYQYVNYPKGSGTQYMMGNGGINTLNSNLNVNSNNSSVYRNYYNFS